MIIGIRGLLIIGGWLGGNQGQVGRGGGVLIRWRGAWLSLSSVVWGGFVAPCESET